MSKNFNTILELVTRDFGRKKFQSYLLEKIKTMKFQSY